MGEREGCFAGRATTQAILLLQPKMLMLRAITLWHRKQEKIALLRPFYPESAGQH